MRSIVVRCGGQALFILLLFLSSMPLLSQENEEITDADAGTSSTDSESNDGDEDADANVGDAM